MAATMIPQRTGAAGDPDDRVGSTGPAGDTIARTTGNATITSRTVEDPKVSDTMDRHLVTIDAGDSLWAAAKLLVKHGGYLVVLEQDHPVGVITDDDVLQNWPSSGWRARRRRIRDVLHERAPCLSTGDDLTQAKAVLHQHGSTAAPVLDSTGRLVGVLRAEDVAAGGGLG